MGAPPAPVAPMIVRPPPPPPPMPATTSCPYDCNAGYSNWEKGWPAGKKDYCCKTAHRGCSPAARPAPVVTTSLPYDCNAGYHNCYQCLLKQRRPSLVEGVQEASGKRVWWSRLPHLPIRV